MAERKESVWFVFPSGTERRLATALRPDAVHPMAGSFTMRVQGSSRMATHGLRELDPGDLAALALGSPSAAIGPPTPPGTSPAAAPWSDSAWRSAGRNGNSASSRPRRPGVGDR